MFSTKKLNRSLFIFGMLLIPILNFIVFWLGVNFNSILLAFKGMKNGSEYWTFNNFELLYEEFFVYPDSNMPMFFKNTMIFFCIGAFIITPISLLLSFFLYKRIFGYKFYRVMFFLPSILSAVVVSSLYKYLLGVSGPIVAIYKIIYAVDYAPSFLSESEYALKCLIIYGLWTGIAGNFILYCGAMNRIPIEVIESGRLEGTNCWTELIKIVIPMIWPTLSTTLIFMVVGIFNSSGNILLLTHGVTSTYTLSYWIFDQVKTFQSYYVPSALGLVFTLIGFPIVLITRHLLNKVYADVEY